MAGSHVLPKYLEPVHKLNFEPRIGFAYSPSFEWARRRMVVRGGYGITHVATTARGRNPIPDFGAGAGPWNYVQSGHQRAPVLEIPSSGILCAGCNPRDPRVPTGNLIAFSKANSAPYIQTWSLTLQTQLPGAMVLSLSYLGQKGTHLYSPQLSVNDPDLIQFENLLNEGGDPAQAVPDPFGRVDASGNLRNVQVQDLMRPYPTLGAINLAGLTNGNSIYHAGTASIERRFSGMVGFRANYTWGKSINSGSSGSLDNAYLYSWGIDRVQNPLNLAMNRSVSTLDSRHRFNVTVNLESPFSRGRPLASDSRVMTALLGNWSINGIGSITSGYPFQVFLGDANGIPNGTNVSQRIRPDVVAGVPMINPRWNKTVANDEPYINPEAFARPAFGNLGNAPRTLDYARTPTRQTLNASLFRELRPFSEKRRYIQLRVEFFNVLNRVTFMTNAVNSPQMFNSLPQSRTGTPLVGPIPYLRGKTAADFPVGSREAQLANGYNQAFGLLDRNNNGQGRIIQLAIRLYW